LRRVGGHNHRAVVVAAVTLDARSAEALSFKELETGRMSSFCGPVAGGRFNRCKSVPAANSSFEYQHWTDVIIV